MLHMQVRVRVRVRLRVRVVLCAFAYAFAYACMCGCVYGCAYRFMAVLIMSYRACVRVFLCLHALSLSFPQGGTHVVDHATRCSKATTGPCTECTLTHIHIQVGGRGGVRV